MKVVNNKRIIVVFLLLLSVFSFFSPESGALGSRVAVKKGGVAVVKCQFPGETEEECKSTQTQRRYKKGHSFYTGEELILG